MQVAESPRSPSPRASGSPEAELPRANRVISIPDFQLDERLTPEQVDFLETYGFIRFKGFVARARAQALYKAVLEVNDALVAKGTEQVKGVPLILGKRADGTRYVQRIPFASLQHPPCTSSSKIRASAGSSTRRGPATASPRTSATGWW